ncbi:ribonuclease Z [Bacillus massiliglaciei]|uniref:ribonuclease Z n=1 Tax=Bacillus massiliglaciei TaxID=1816693 RepID=UPI000AEC91A5|nr:ribonuclease Z [Bacillus massiliglaciei]
MEFVFLGTGAGMPAKARNVSSIALQLLEERGTVWLFDCGEATQHQILHTAVKPRKIEKIFITHLHGDHIYGLPGLLGSRSFQGGTEKLTVYGPEGIADFINTSLKVSGTYLKYPLEIIEIQEGKVFEDETFTVSCLELDHGILSFGYRIVEKDRPGSLQVDRLLREGIKPGPQFKVLKNGGTLTLDDGRKIHGPDYLGEAKKGRVISILGDTRYCQNAIKLASDCDYLVHEATFSADETEMAHSYCHSTTSQAAETAAKAGAKNLILTHISSRYTAEDIEKLKKEGEEIFPKTLIAEDLLSIKIPLHLEE